MPVIEAKQLRKSYTKHKGSGTVEVIHGIDLSVSAGESVGYVGMNGAGKSTTIKMLTGLIPPTSGTLSVLGMDPFRHRKKYVQNIGVVFGQRNQLLWDLPVNETFKFHKQIYHLTEKNYNERMAVFSELLDLGDLLDSRALTLSLGQRMKCNLALALLHDPKILFLDEATIGLDLIVKQDIQKMLLQQVEEMGTTLLFTSHDMKDIAKVCQRIIVLDKGTIMEDMSLRSFVEKYGGSKTVVLEVAGQDDLQQLIMLCGEYWEGKIDSFRADEKAGQLHISFRDSFLSVPQIMETIYAKHISVTQLRLEEAQLEDAITKIYNQSKEVVL